jgi:uncharacterized damage-inducible protein DinB
LGVVREARATGYNFSPAGGRRIMTQKRPQKSDYAIYYENYIALVPGGDFLEILEQQRSTLLRLLASLTEQQAEFRYAPGKWSIKETIGHVSDAERIFAYRLLRIARGDQTPLASFEQDPYIATGNFSARKLADLLEEFSAVRQASITLIRSLDEKAWVRRGTASQKEITALALAFIIAGHERHHLLILEERYLPALPPG